MYIRGTNAAICKRVIEIMKISINKETIKEQKTVLRLISLGRILMVVQQPQKQERKLSIVCNS